MNSPEMHLAGAGKETRPCETCGTIFTPSRDWSRFCRTRGNACRNAFHGAEARVEAIKAAAPEMYEALRTIRLTECFGAPWDASGKPCPHCIAMKAIKDLKPPVEPKALLEKAKA